MAGSTIEICQLEGSAPIDMVPTLPVTLISWFSSLVYSIALPSRLAVRSIRSAIAMSEYLESVVAVAWLAAAEEPQPASTMANAGTRVRHRKRIAY